MLASGQVNSALSPVLVVVAAINSTTAARLTSGLARQFCVMWQKTGGRDGILAQRTMTSA
jgi:hypothetical protein